MTNNEKIRFLLYSALDFATEDGNPHLYVTNMDYGKAFKFSYKREAEGDRMTFVIFTDGDELDDMFLNGMTYDEFKKTWLKDVIDNNASLDF